MANYQTYVVKVKPAVVLYAGTCTMGEYSLEVYAKDRAAAIKEARRQRRAEEGRFAPKASYSAKVKEQA